MIHGRCSAGITINFCVYGMFYSIFDNINMAKIFYKNSGSRKIVRISSSWIFWEKGKNDQILCYQLKQ